MYQMAKTAREKMKAKARALAGEKDQKVDSSDWTPAPLLKAEIKTGARPIMRPSAKGIGESNAARDTKAAIGRDMKRGAFKSGGAVKDAGVKDKKALGAIDPSPKRGAAGHYKKGGKVKKAGGGSMLEKLVGKPKTGSDLSQVGKMGTAQYSQEEKGALNRALNQNDALPAAGEAAERSGKYQNYKKGGRTKRADGGNIKIPSTLHKYDDSGKRIDPSRYDIYNTRTGKVVGKAKSLIGSRRAVDRRDNDYGAYAHRAIPVYDNVQDAGSNDDRTAKAAGGSLMSALKGTKKGAKKKGAKTDINIVINAGGKSPARHPADRMAPPADMGAMPPPPSLGIAGPPPAGPMGDLGAGGPMMPPGLPIGRKAGGRITKVAKSYKDMEAGAASGEGRLQKTEIAKLHKGAPERKAGGRISKVAKSYKDMTAGAASGEGRLQKEDIAKAKKGRSK